MTSVLFVCLGNICRSPLAEGAFRKVVEDLGAKNRVLIDSAGTGGWHQGEAPDPRSIAVAARHGIDISAQRARQVVKTDFSRFEHILAMDSSNLTNLRKLSPAEAPASIRLFLETDETDVPDPYYGGPAGFETVFRMVMKGAEDLAAELGLGR
ncbi:low molecular weight protein-tyrosine-phosphatase [Pannonibacter phragmitetus]|uniref:low molecular weight protein-tyrosine-phosphatase n=1 Tax=Pannonibacter phragmitetus TaxID=121719 RepID=UPI003D2EB52B